MTVRALAFVEGPTEEKFVREIVGPSLAPRSVFIVATTPGRRRAQGGVQRWGRIKKELLRYLKEDADRVVTTMFDYYGLPSDWPGTEEAMRARSHINAAQAIEHAILADVCDELGQLFDPRRFIPYIQMHEFEALLFSDTQVLAEVVQNPALQSSLDGIVEECGEPEGIDDNPDTAPSKRIRTFVSDYQKVVHGIIAAKRIGLSTMRERCPHFAHWLESLEDLGEKQG